MSVLFTFIGVVCIGLLVYQLFTGFDWLKPKRRYGQPPPERTPPASMMGFDSLAVNHKYFEDMPADEQAKRCGTCGGRLDDE